MSRVCASLLALRLSIFLVMLMWTLDKFLNPEHAAGVYSHFYLAPALGAGAMRAIGAVELLFLVGFVLGYRKRLTYGAVLVFHAISTLSSYAQYLSPWEPYHLLFFAAWPMLVACFTLYWLRDLDTKLTL
jgi:hypothetical protein